MATHAWRLAIGIALVGRMFVATAQQDQIDRLKPIGDDAYPNRGLFGRQRALQPQSIDRAVALDGKKLARDEAVVGADILERVRFPQHDPQKDAVYEFCAFLAIYAVETVLNY